MDAEILWERLDKILKKEPALVSVLEMAAALVRKSPASAGQAAGLLHCRPVVEKLAQVGEDREALAAWLLGSLDAILGKYCHWQEVFDAVLLEGFTQPLTGLAFSAAGGLLAAVDRGGTVQLWRGAGEELLHTLRSAAEAHCLALSPDGARLAVGGGRAIHLWDAAGGRRLRYGRGLFARKGILRGHGREVLALAFSPDGKWLYSGGADGRLLAWDMERGKLARRLGRHAEAVSCLAFSSDGRTLVSGDHAGVLRVWDAVQGRLLNRLDWHIFRVSGVAFFPDGKRLAAATHYARAGLIPVEDALASVDEQADRLHLLARRWSAEKRTKNMHQMLGARARLWELQQVDLTRLLGDLDGGIGAATDVAVSPDGRQLALAGINGEISLWDAEKRTLRAKLLGHTAGVSKLAFAPGGGLLASAGRDAVVRLWRV